MLTHERTFWGQDDDPRAFMTDGAFRQKVRYIEEQGLVVWRLHDHLHRRQPDIFAVGLAQSLGWEQYLADKSYGRYSLPPSTLSALVAYVESRLIARTIRVIGDPQTQVTKVGIRPGFASLPRLIDLFPTVDACLVGETREWEGAECAYDMFASGLGKGLIVVGHAVSEDPGMKLCAAWLRTLFPEVPVAWVPAGEPFWRPV